VSAQPPAKKTAGQIEKETNSSPQSSQRTLRKKIKNNLCALRVLCGEILLENGIGFHEVSYERRLWPRAASQIEKRNYIFVINHVVSYKVSGREGISTLVIIFVHYVARSFCETIKLLQEMP
jgi:hypothetical protein